MRTMLRLILAFLLLAAPVAASERQHVYLVIVDGLDARFATAARMPALFDQRVRGGRSSLFTDAHAVMPARTNPNHVTLLTGTYPQAHGITGNAYWRRERGAPVEKLDAAALIEVETLFTVAEATRPALVTLGVFGKPKLGRLFAAVPGRQRAPDQLWSPERAAPADRDPATGYSPDAVTMDALLTLSATAEPDRAVVNLADVDRMGHAHGPESEEYATAVRRAGDAVARLVGELKARRRWSHSVVIVTADHGFDALTPTPDRPHTVITLAPVLERAGVAHVQLAADGGVEHVYADVLARDAREVGEAGTTLARVAEIARATAGVAEVLARLPVPGVAALDAVHPQWHLLHERAGDLLLVAARGHEFVDPFDPVDAALRGNHGGPGECTVPLLVTGGYAGLEAAPAGSASPSLADVGATVAALLALRPPRRIDGTAVPGELTGHPVAALRDHTDGSTR